VIPAGVKVSFEGHILSVEGPKGKIQKEVPQNVGIKIEANQVLVEEPTNTGRTKAGALWGTWRSLINGYVDGVTNKFIKELQLEGVGFRAAVSGKKLTLNVGFTHPVEIEAPEGITFVVKENIISIEGCDKALVGQVAADVRKVRKPEPYKGKGIRYKGEVVRHKEGKKAGVK